jgi:hypothetical protein
MCNIFSSIPKKIIFSNDNHITNEMKNINYTLYNHIDYHIIHTLLHEQKSKMIENKNDNTYRILIMMDDFFSKDLLRNVKDIRNLFRLNRTFGITFILIQNNISIFPISPLRSEFDYIFLYHHFNDHFYQKIYKYGFSENFISESEFIEYINKYKQLVINYETISYKLKDTLLYFS